MHKTLRSGKSISIQAHLKTKTHQFALVMSWPCRITAQLLGLTLLLLGWVSSCVTTSVPLWKSLNLDLNELEVWKMGLWQICIFQDEHVMVCKGYASLLALPLEIRISRILMVASNMVGFLALSLSILGCSWLKMRAQKVGSKRQLGMAGGALSCVSGMATLLPVSWIAFNTVQEFWDETLPEIVPRWEFGTALFLGWFAGFFLILGGFLVFFSAHVPEGRRQPGELPVNQKQEVQRLPFLANHNACSPPKNAFLVS